MPCVHTGVAEASHAELGRLLEQPGLIEAGANGICRSRQEREVGKTDAALGQCRCALRKTVELLAGADAISGGATRKVAVGLNPGDGTVEALLVVLVGLGELGGDS